MVFNAVAGATRFDSAAVSITTTSANAVTELRAITRYADGQASGWLTADLDHSTLPATLTLSARTTPLPPGEYAATVELKAEGAAAESVTVTTRVVTGAAIGLSAGKICFVTEFGGPAPRQNEYVWVKSVDGSVIDGLTATIVYDTGQPTGWLEAVLDVTTAPARLRLLPSVGILPVGSYTATVQVASPRAGNSPVPVRVTMMINLGVGNLLKLELVTVGNGAPGSGRLSASGIDCVLTSGVQSGDCEEPYAPGTVVRFAATPAPGNFFYNEPLDGSSTDSLGIDYIASKVGGTLIAGFGPPPSTLHVVILREGNYVGTATVYGDPIPFIEPDIQCFDPVPTTFNNLCDRTYVTGTTVTLFPEPDYGEQFLRWEGPCTGTTCVVPLTQPRSDVTVTAVFGPKPTQRTLQLQVTGPGRVSNDLDQQCSNRDCSYGGHYYSLGEIVRLDAIPDEGSTFAGWTNCPAPSGLTCDLVIVADVVVGAHFVNCVRTRATGTG